MRYELTISGKGLLVLPAHLASEMDQPDGGAAWLYVGSLRSAVIVSVGTSGSSIVVGSDVAGELKLVPGWWQVRKETMGVRLGPVIGVVANDFTKWAPGESNWARYLREIEAGLGILMTRESLCAGAPTVFGRILSQDGQSWVTGEYPRPDALYIQVYPLNNSFKRMLDRVYTGRYFNCVTRLNKWQTHEILIKSKDIEPYLPETERFIDGSGQITRRVARYGSIYLKPVLRSQGLGILKITGIDGGLLVNYRENFSNSQKLAPSESAVIEQFKEMMGNRAYIVQRAIKLPETSGHTSDFRVLVQKKDDARWHVTAMGGRLGSAGSIVNNLDSGGRRTSVTDIISDSGLPAAVISKEILWLGPRVAEALESDLGPMGEIGLDLCIDIGGRMWIIEVNGRPDKTFFTTFYNASVARNVYKAPMLYSAFLAGFA